MVEDKNKRWLQLTGYGVLCITPKQSDRVRSWSEKCSETEIVVVRKDSLSFSVRTALSAENSLWRTKLLTQPITETERCLKTVNRAIQNVGFCHITVHRCVMMQFWTRFWLTGVLLYFIAHRNLPDLISAGNVLFPVLRFALNGVHIQSIMEIQV